MTPSFLFQVVIRWARGKVKMRERARSRLKEAQSDGRTNYREVYQSHTFVPSLFSHPHLSFSCALHLRFNPLSGASSFCILIPPQRGADNLGRGFFKLAPLTRYAARWVSYRNNFQALFPPNRRARSSFFPWYIFFFLYFTQSFLRRSLWNLRRQLNGSQLDN